jgi:hypothetical protein
MASQKSGQYANTWEGVTQAAKAAGAKYPELVAAQWACESGWGKHAPGENYFGLKGEGQTLETEEVIDGKRVTVLDGFLTFPSLGACVSYLVERWYKDWQGYKGVNRAADRNAAARELQKQGYATDPDQPAKLIKLMDEHAPRSKTASQASKLQVKPELFHLQATHDTWLKKEPVSATELGDKQKVAVPKGKSYAVCAYAEEPADAHALVELAGGAGTWYVYEPHWKRELPSGEAMPASVDWADFGCLVTPNLTVGEVLQWDKRRVPGENASVRTRLLRTAAEFQKVRDAWGQPLGLTSFYRPEPINAQVGGVPGSRHTTGEAFDLYPTTRSLESFYQWIRTRWTGGLGDGRTRGFIHLDTAGGGCFVPGSGVRPGREWDY